MKQEESFMRKYFYSILLFMFISPLFSQTPQQLEILRQKGVDTAGSASPGEKNTSDTITQGKEAMKKLEGKLLVQTDNFNIVTASTGDKLCTMDVSLINFSSFDVLSIQIFFDWDDVGGTYAEFSSLQPKKGSKVNIGMVGEVCSHVALIPKMRVPICKMKEKNESFCRSLVTFLKLE